jgi:hypothetical protein
MNAGSEESSASLGEIRTGRPLGASRAQRLVHRGERHEREARFDGHGGKRAMGVEGETSREKERQGLDAPWRGAGRKSTARGWLGNREGAGGQIFWVARVDEDDSDERRLEIGTAERGLISTYGEEESINGLRWLIGDIFYFFLSFSSTKEYIYICVYIYPCLVTRI